MVIRANHLRTFYEFHIINSTEDFKNVGFKIVIKKFFNRKVNLILNIFNL